MPRAVIVAGRQHADEAAVARLSALAATARILVAIATPFAGMRPWRAVQGRIRTETSSASIVDSVMAWSSTVEHAASRALMDQLAVVGGILPDVAGLRVASADPDHYVVAGMAGRTAVVLSGSECQVDSSQLQVDIAGTGSRWRARFDGGARARPAVIERFSEGRISTEPIWFESGYRSSWIDLYECLVHGARVPAHLSIDTRQLTLARRLASIIKAGPRGDTARPIGEEDGGTRASLRAS
jgi:hypothetical protein